MLYAVTCAVVCRLLPGHWPAAISAIWYDDHLDTSGDLVLRQKAWCKLRAGPRRHDLAQRLRPRPLVSISAMQLFQASECFRVQMLPRLLELESFASVGFVDNVPSPTGNKRFHGSFANRRGSAARLAATIARNPSVIRELPHWGLD